MTDGNEDDVNNMTKNAEYDKTNAHLVQSKDKQQKSHFRPGLLDLCESLLVIDPKERLG